MFAASTNKTAAQPIITDHQAKLAAAREIPQPVNNATYAARQSGHFGIAVNTTLGTIQLTTRPVARTHDRSAAATADRSSQQHPFLMRSLCFLSIDGSTRRRTIAWIS